ncbi:hypothetical protein V3481_018381 [Fusarium oxysporum f. sp. vasinfectum]
MPSKDTTFANVEMQHALNIPATMMFNPSGFGLNPGATSVVGNMVVSEIGLIGAPPNMAGPYIGAGGTIDNVYGMWLGPDPDIGGFSIEFSVVGPYPPLKEGDKAPVSNTASAEVGSKVKWTRVNFDELSLRELKCAEEKLSKAKSNYESNEEALKLLESWLTQVSDARKKYE